MYQLFKNYKFNRNNKIDSPQFPYTQKLIINELARLHHYYRLTSIVVPTDHLLTQLLKNINVSYSRDNLSFVDFVSYQVPRLAKTFKLVNPSSMDPQAMHGVFYNNDVTEFIILDDGIFDIEKAYEKWKYISPIKVHYHPFTDIFGGVPNGNYQNQNNETGYAVISINLPMLALQYKAWKEQVRDKQDIKDQTIEFLFKYPLLNMMFRHNDLAIINRTINRYLNRPVCPYQRRHPIALRDMSTHVDKVIEDRIKILNTNNFKFDEVFNIFYTLYGKNWLNTIRPPDMPPMRSVKWIMELTVLPYMEYFLIQRKNNGIDYNNAEINLVLRAIRNLETDNVYFKEAYSKLNEKFNIIKTLAGG